MKGKLQTLFLSFVLLTGSCAAIANEPDVFEPAKKETSPSSNALQADWVFSGMVTNESGEHYNYYFQIQRNDRKFHAVATLIDSQTKNVLLYEENTTLIEHFDGNNWQVGSLFLQFNPINNSWVFGVKTKDKKGFNFKVDMLKQAENTPTIQDLRSGIELLINQTGRLNGHLLSGTENK